MDELSNFCQTIKSKLGDEESLSIGQAREYVRALPKEQQFGECPFINICGENKKLMPPKSISIMGQTGWSSAYARQDKTKAAVV